MAQKIVLPDQNTKAPEPPPHGPIVWARKNLFSTLASGILTVVGVAIILLAVRGLAGFALADDRKWQAITANMRLLMVQAYPELELWRVWVSVGIVATLLGLSFAFWRVGGKTTPRSVLQKLQIIAAAIAGFVLLAPVSGSIRTAGLVLAAVLAGAAYGAARMLGDRAKAEVIPVLGLAVAGGAILLGILWLIQVPVPDPAGTTGDRIVEKIATTTLGPWTLLFIATIIAYFVGVVLRNAISEQAARKTITGLWVLSFPVVVLHLTRATNFDNIGAATVARPDGGLTVANFIMFGVVFAAVGGALIWFLASPRIGELGRGLAGLLFVIAVASWLISLAILIRILLLLLAMFALAGPTFAGGERRATTRYVGVWVGTVVVTVYLMLLAVGETTIVTPNEVPFGGFFLTWILAIAGIALSFPIGVVMALARTSTMSIFRLLSTFYIEVIRGVPFITWLLVSIVVFPILFPPDTSFVAPSKVILFIAFFSGAYLAENVRGGLQSISKGQNEAANALGMTTLQRTVFITLPQALRAVIPALVGQVIALFKDTSLVAIVGLFDLLKIGRDVISTQSGIAGGPAFNFIGTQREGLIAVAVMYWIFTFTFSKVSQRLEKKLGLGTR